MFENSKQREKRREIIFLTVSLQAQRLAGKPIASRTSHDCSNTKPRYAKQHVVTFSNGEQRHHWLFPRFVTLKYGGPVAPRPLILIALYWARMKQVPPDEAMIYNPDKLA